MDLVSAWRHGTEEPLADELTQPVLQIAVQCLDGDGRCHAWDWARAVAGIADKHLDEKLRVLALALVPKVGRDPALDDQAAEVLAALARERGPEVMEALGNVMLTNDSPAWYLIRPIAAILDAIDDDVVIDWLSRNGRTGAELLAPHLPSPDVNLSDSQSVPRVTAWLLTEYQNDEEVFRAFLLGRHAMETFWGPASRRYADFEVKYSAYLRHPLPRVRDWAQHEMDSARQMIRWDEEREAEFNRE